MALAPGTWPRPILRIVRHANKHILNPFMRARSGRKNAYAATISHTGRKSGKKYVTPVGAERINDGFLIPVAYGTQADLLRNILAAGHATVTIEGQTYRVTQPELIDAPNALPQFPARRQRAWKRAGIPHYLSVRLT